MTIAVGDKIPSAKLKTMTAEGPKDISTDDIFNGKKVVLFAVPGAFTPTCSAKHLPGFVEKAAEIKGKGVDTIACLAVNDAFVMGAWGKAQNTGDKVLMLADGSRRFHQAARPRSRPHRPGHGRALQALCDAGRQRHRQGAASRSTRRVRGLERRTRS